MDKRKSKQGTHIWRHIGGPMVVSKDDSRYNDYVSIQERTGVSPDECWNLDHTISLFILPRLEAFKKSTIAVPSCFGTMKEWHSEMNKMISAFRLVSIGKEDEKSCEKIEIGLDSFRKYFQYLWW